MPKPVKGLLRVIAGGAIVWIIYLLKGNIWTRLYPLVIASAMLAAFALSLLKTPLIEIFARKMGHTLDPRGVDYCRKATIAWTLFMSVHTLITASILFASAEVWALYNGCLAYLLIGAMFLGEFIVRRRNLNANR